MAPELAKIELSLVAENKEKEAKQKENLKVKFEALTSSSMLDDYFTSDSNDYSYGSTLLRGEVTVLSGKACEGGHVTGMESFFIRFFEILIFGAFSDSCEKFSFLSGFDHVKYSFFNHFLSSHRKFYFESKSG